MYPLKFNPILKSTIWGGDKIIPFKHLNSEQQQVGESWEISDVPGDESVVANGTDAGKNLTQMVQEYKGALVGETPSLFSSRQHRHDSSSAFGMQIDHLGINTGDWLLFATKLPSASLVNADGNLSLLQF